MTPIISVIIAAYNVEACIDRALDSVLAQTLSEFEIIVVDDGSADGTVALVEKRGLLDPRISVVRQPENQGPAAARNRGLEIAQGEWAAILDADDAYEPDRLERMVQLGRSENADIMADNLTLFDTGVARATGVAFPRMKENELLQVDLENYLTNCIVGVSEFDYGQLKPLMRTSFLGAHQLQYPKGLRHGEDFMLYAEILIAGGKLVITGKPGYIFTQRYGSESGQASPFSRTKLSFGSMLDYTVSLMQRPQIASQPRVVDLLQQRARAIRWHETNTLFSDYARRRKLTDILKMAMRNWRTWIVIGQRLARRF